MKKLICLIALFAMGLGLFAQDSTNPSLLRTSKAIKALNTVPYAWMYFADESATVTIAAEDTWTVVSQGDSLWNNGATQRITLTNDSLYATVAGDYLWDLDLSYAMTANDTVHLAVKHNSTVKQLGRAVSIGAEVITFGGSGILPSVDVGDTIQVMVQNSNDATNLTFLDGSFLFRLIRYD
jgi:hypothetical protein